MNLIRTGIVLAVLLGLLLPSSFQFATDSASTPKIYSDDTDTIEDDEDLASGSGDGSGDGIDDGIGETDIRNSYSTQNVPTTSEGTYDNSNEKQHRKLSDNNDSSNDSNTEEYGETATLPASDHQARHDSTSYSSKERSGTEATVGNEMIENGNTVTTQLTPTLTANSSSPTNVTSTTPSSKSSRGSSPNPARFLFRSFDCLVLYFFSLCCSMWWYRFI